MESQWLWKALNDIRRGGDKERGHALSMLQYLALESRSQTVKRRANEEARRHFAYARAISQ